MVIIHYYSSHVVLGPCNWPFWGLFAYLFSPLFLLMNYLQHTEMTAEITDDCCRGWMGAFSLLCNYSLFSPWFSIKFSPSFPQWQETHRQKEKHFSIASGTFPLPSGKASLFCCCNDYSAEKSMGEKKRTEGREKIKWKNTVAVNMPPPHTPPTHGTNEPKHTRSSRPIKRLE